MNGGNIMTYKQARRILHPETTRQSLEEIAYYAGFDVEAKRKAIDEACLVACEVLDKYIQEEQSR